jgi:hypothetical protein
MSDYLRHFQAAREVVLPCLYLTPGTELPRHAEFNPRDAEQEARRQARMKLRVSSHTLPGVERAVAKACRLLRVPRTAVHAFVSPETGRNAHCLRHADEPVIVFGSALVELMTEDELACVAGHEIGHFLLPEAHALCDDETVEGRVHHRAAEITMDRIGLVACGDLRAACSAEMKLMSGLKEPHLRLDVSAFIHEGREAFDGTFRREEDETHPPAQLRLRAIIEFAGSDACRAAWGLEGGTSITSINQSISRLLHEQIDRHTMAKAHESIVMAKAWLFCLSKIHGQATDIQTLNRFRPEVDADHLGRAWASLSGFNEIERADHAKRRFRNSLESSVSKAPHLAEQLFVLMKTDASLRPILKFLD